MENVTSFLLIKLLLLNSLMVLTGRLTKTQVGTYNWLKNNKEPINVATSRTRDKLIVLADWKSLNRLLNSDGRSFSG